MKQTLHGILGQVSNANLGFMEISPMVPPHMLRAVSQKLDQLFRFKHLSSNRKHNFVGCWVYEKWRDTDVTILPDYIGLLLQRGLYRLKQLWNAGTDWAMFPIIQVCDGWLQQLPLLYNAC